MRKRGEETDKTNIKVRKMSIEKIVTTIPIIGALAGGAVYGYTRSKGIEIHPELLKDSMIYGMSAVTGLGGAVLGMSFSAMGAADATPNTSAKYTVLPVLGATVGGAAAGALIGGAITGAGYLVGSLVGKVV